MDRKRILGIGIIVLLGVSVVFGILYLPIEEQGIVVDSVPKLSNISAEYATSTEEIIIRWSVVNKDIKAINTGVRYDAMSHNTSTATSETYPNVAFPVLKGDRFEARIDVSTIDEFYYRIQVADNNEFLWSSEGEVLISHE